MANEFHAFYKKAYGNDSVYLATEDETKIIELVKASHDGGNVRDLRVVYGQLLEFEPAKVVETYRIKGGGPPF